MCFLLTEDDLLTTVFRINREHLGRLAQYSTTMGLFVWVKAAEKQRYKARMKSNGNFQRQDCGP